MAVEGGTNCGEKIDVVHNSLEHSITVKGCPSQTKYASEQYIGPGGLAGRVYAQFVKPHSFF